MTTRNTDPRKRFDAASGLFYSAGMRQFTASMIVTSSLWAGSLLAATPSSLDDWLAQHQFTTTPQQRIQAMASELALSALGMLGVPYKWGGNTAQEGLDCSGFVRAVFGQAAGIALPRRSAEQAQVTHAIPDDQLQPGDLVFFNTLRRQFSHVGIYIGDGRFVHSPRAGAVVRVEDMNTPYWRTRFNGARRVLGAP